jgi:hypothetical protein
MGRLFIDGFEKGASDLWFVSGSIAIVTASAYAMTGSYAISAAAGSTIRRDLGTRSALYGAFRFRPTANGSISFMRIYLYPTIIATLYYDAANRRLQVYSGDSATLLASGATDRIQVSTTYHIQFKYIPDSASGVFDVKVNGVSDIAFSGNTVPGAQTTLDQVEFRGAYYGGQLHQYDDFVFDDATWIGNSKIAAIAPNGVGNSTQWDPSAGLNYQCVDEIPASDTDYVFTNVVDEVDTYAMSDLPASAAVVKCVQVVARARKEGTATPQNINLAVRTTGGDAYSADQALESSFKPHINHWENNPGTSSPWTVSEVNAMEAGVKSKT